MLNFFTMDCSTNDDPYYKYINEEPVVHFAQLPKAEQDEIMEDMQDWEAYMYCKEAQTRVGTFVDDLQPVRVSGELFAENIIYFKVIDELSKTKDIALSRRENLCSNEDMHSLAPDFTNIEIRPRENWGHYVSAQKEENRSELAKIFKAKGNEAYRAKDYKKAHEFYSSCIAYGIDDIGIAACNNRAQTNIKLGNFTEAVSDLNEVLKTDPRNEKALFRRAACRKEMKMYREALKDIDALSKYYPNESSARGLLAEIEKITQTLNGKSYRLRENASFPETFSVDESQLLSYAESDLEYLLEVDRNGCFKKCVCNHCTFEDRPNFQSNNRLRIERPKWKPLTLKLLEDKGISQKSTSNSSSDNDSVSKENGSVSKATAAKNICARSPFTNAVKNSNGTLLNGINGATPNTQNEVIPLSGDRAELVRSIEGHHQKGHNVQHTNKREFNRLRLRKYSPHYLEEAYNPVMSSLGLTRMLDSILKDFNLNEEWDLIREYLEVFARAKPFPNIMKTVDERTSKDVNNTLQLAVNLKLKNADTLKELYCS